uniref:Uncharacterized protein n=1 Tax=virus sp. ctx9V1 TaxID=2828001 RepID=A0A8S5RDC9_9VIRU|nr:MAG TPA: hypothetical protein [virus sp. ctx9V1]
MVRKLHSIAPVYIVTSYNIIIVSSNRARLIINPNLTLRYKSAGTICVIYNRLSFTDQTINRTSLITIRCPHFISL